MPPVAELVTPMVASRTVANVSCTSLAAPNTRPYQLPEIGDVEPNTTGAVAVPLTRSAPLTVSSVRAGSTPPALGSALPSARTSTPASIVSELPAGTVTSPWRTYGLPANAQVVLSDKLPAGTIVSASAAAVAAKTIPKLSTQTKPFITIPFHP